jgi:hypothetical protein
MFEANSVLELAESFVLLEFLPARPGVFEAAHHCVARAQMSSVAA